MTRQEQPANNRLEGIDAVCDVFEASWRAGGRPKIEDFLVAVPLEDRTAAFPKLLLVELTWRKKAGEQLSEEEYRERFPEYRPQVKAAIDRLLGRDVATTEFIADRWLAGLEPVPGYRLVRPLGQGGMGEVWEARGPGGIPAALKRVRFNGRCGESERKALDLLKNVRHPHLLSIHGYWIEGPLLIIGSELADESLHSLLLQARGDREGGLAAEQVTRYLTDAAEALDYLGRPIHRTNSHTVRIQHRDVKPANLLVQGNAIKVADFGLARALEQVLENHSVSMTPTYAPPEFFRGEISPASDQYSLGVTYYQLRTGRVPFSGSPAEIMEGHLHGEPNLEGLDEAERRVVARALAKRPELRWAGCVKFIGELVRAMEPVAISSQPQESPESPAAETKFHGQAVTTGMLLIAGELVPLPLQRTDVRAAITAATAEVAVAQVFVNTHNRALEATYVFPLPEDSAVHRLRITIDDRMIEGVVREKAEARQTYEEAKQEGHGAALVEQTTPNIFTTSVANILPGQEIRVEIAYLQPLPFQDGQYRFVFPMVVSPRYVLGTSETAEAIVSDVPAAIRAPRLPQGMLRGDRVNIEVDLDAGVPLCGFDSPSHDLTVVEESGASRVKLALRRDDEIPNRDFVLNYRVAGPMIEHALFYEPEEDKEPGTFLLLTTPPAPQFATARPRQIVFVLDRSGSMGGKPMEQAKQAARQLLDRLAPGDVFNVIAFDTEVTPLAGVPLAAEEGNLRRARAFIDQLSTRGGGTEMLEPLRLGLKQPRPDHIERIGMVIFLTDGSVSGERELLAALRPDIGSSRIIGFGIGTAVNRHLLNKLAAAGRGFAEFIFPGENIARVVDRTLKRLSYPVLTDARLDWRGIDVEAVIPEHCPDLYRDQPLLVMGRYRGRRGPALLGSVLKHLPFGKRPSGESGPGLVLRGRIADRAYETEITDAAVRRHEGGVPLAALWARRQIDALMDRMWERPEEETSLRKQIIELAVRYRLASDYTSFLAVEYRSAADRAKARGAVSVEIPQYMPQGMDSAPPAPAAVSPMLRATMLQPGGIHEKLKRVRPPRVHITYEYESQGVVIQKELPLVIGVIADLSGGGGDASRPLNNRKFIQIDRDNFDEVMAQRKPSLSLYVENTLQGDGSLLGVTLKFQKMEDFEPAGVVRQVPPLQELLNARKAAVAEKKPRAEIRTFDEALSKQLLVILHSPEFQRLEGIWRGLNYLVMNTETSAMLKLKVLQATKAELLEDFRRAGEVEKSILFRQLWDNEFLCPGSEPYGTLLGDYEFANSPEDIELLTWISQAAARVFCPFIAAASPKLFALADFTELARLRDVERILGLAVYSAWSSFRQSDASRFVALALPRVLARQPYRARPDLNMDFDFDEVPLDEQDGAKPTSREHYTWMNSAYVMGTKISDSFAKYGSCVAIRGAEGGGKVDGLPASVFPNDVGELDSKCPTEIGITDRLGPQLARLGFLGLWHGKDLDFAAFPNANSVWKPAAGTSGPPTDAAICAGLPFTLVTSRLMHYLLIIARDKVGSFTEPADVEAWLNRWIHNYVTSDPHPSQETKAKYPLRQARISLNETAAGRGRYRVTAWMQPWLQLEELQTPVQMDAEIPCLADA